MNTHSEMRAYALGFFTQQRRGLIPWSFCSLATRAYALWVYLCSKRRGLMP